MSACFVSLCMIVKNEAKNLPRCLESVRNSVQEIIIVDTGSTDNSIEIGLSYGAKIYSFEWKDDFSAARNFGLEHASGEWILVLDADETLDEQSAQSLLPTLTASKADAYNCILRNVLSLSPVISYQDQVFEGWIRIFRNRPQYRFESIYHESVFPSLRRHHAIIENGPFMIWHFGMLNENVQGGETSRRERAWRYLLRAAEKEPNNGNLLFYLGNEYYLRGDYENAYKTLKRATLEVGTELAHPYQAKRGLLSLAEIAYQKGEFALAAGSAKGALAIEGYSELTAQAWQLLFNAFVNVLYEGINHAIEIPSDRERHQQLVHYSNLLQEFSQEIQSQINSSASITSQQFFASWLLRLKELNMIVEEARKIQSG